LTVELLLNPSWRAFALKEFNGINPSCWHFDDNENHLSGTFLFWGIDESGRAIKLREESDSLVGGNGFSIELSKEEIARGLSNKKIVPNIFVVFSVLAFEIGLSCFGGFMQCWYLEKIKDGWLSLLSYFGLTDEADLVKTVPVTNYVTGLTVLMFERDDGTYLPDGADIINRGGIRTKELIELSKTTLEESFLPALPFIYRSIFGVDAELNHVDTTAVLQETDLKRKLVLTAPI
jgi:hypothetical protein